MFGWTLEKLELQLTEPTYYDGVCSLRPNVFFNYVGEVYANVGLEFSKVEGPENRIVKRVQRNSSAEKAGIVDGDEIVRVDSFQLNVTEMKAERLLSGQYGTVVEVEYKRNGQVVCCSLIRSSNFIVWSDLGSTEPTYEEIATEKARLIKIWQAAKYKRDRVQNYPSFYDYLDGVVKSDQAQMDAYIQKCLEVKDRFPKPSSS